MPRRQPKPPRAPIKSYRQMARSPYSLSQLRRQQNQGLARVGHVIQTPHQLGINASKHRIVRWQKQVRPSINGPVTVWTPVFKKESTQTRAHERSAETTQRPPKPRETPARRSQKTKTKRTGHRERANLPTREKRKTKKNL